MDKKKTVGGALAALLAAPLAVAQTQPQATPGTTAEVVVSATKTPEDPVDVANAVTVISGEELRRSGARTIADALQDVVGVDTGQGSDNGSRLANIGL